MCIRDSIKFVTVVMVYLNIFAICSQLFAFISYIFDFGLRLICGKNTFFTILYLEFEVRLTFGNIRHTVLLLLLIYFTQLIRILFFDCSVEEDGAVAGVRISGEDESFLDDSAIVDATAPPEAKNQMPSSSEISGTGKRIVKRKYHDFYLDIGFVETSDNKPQCVICGKVLPNSAMFPAKMRRHFEGVHPECKGKPIDFFRRKGLSLIHI